MYDRATGQYKITGGLTSKQANHRSPAARPIRKLGRVDSEMKLKIYAPTVKSHLTVIRD
jgi:hypothetical protein